MSVPVPEPAAAVRPSFRQTYRNLKRAQKSASRSAPAYSRFVNRKAGRLLASACHTAGLTPNQVTMISGAFSAMAVALLATVRPTGWWGVLVALLLMIGYAFDSADGQVARLRGGGSAGGEWLDHVIDSIKISALHLAVLIGWFRFWKPEHHAVLLIPIGYVWIAAVHFFVMILTDQLRRSHPQQAPAPVGASWKDVVRAVLVLPIDYGVLCILFVLWPWHVGFAGGYTLMFVGNVAYLLAALPKWFREVSAFRPEVSAHE